MVAMVSAVVIAFLGGSPNPSPDMATPVAIDTQMSPSSIVGTMAGSRSEDELITAPFDDLQVALVRGGADDFSLSDGESSWDISVLQKVEDGFQPVAGMLSLVAENYETACQRAAQGDPDVSMVETEEGLCAVVTLESGMLEVWDPNGGVTLMASPGILNDCITGENWRICTTRILRHDGKWKIIVLIYYKGEDGKWVLAFLWSSEWLDLPVPELGPLSGGPVTTFTQEDVSQLSAMLKRLVPTAEMRTEVMTKILNVMMPEAVFGEQEAVTTVP
jgi:hypothetical protein